tara:strand:- start:449 stop:874 length:426 start_codon:yes stop_codon:yes gene_type:complete
MANEKKILPENWHAPMSYSESQKLKKISSFPGVYGQAETPRMKSDVDPMDPRFLTPEAGGTRKRTPEEIAEREAHNIHAARTNEGSGAMGGKLKSMLQQAHEYYDYTRGSWDGKPWDALSKAEQMGMIDEMQQSRNKRINN